MDIQWYYRIIVNLWSGGMEGCVEESSNNLKMYSEIFKGELTSEIWFKLGCRVDRIICFKSDRLQKCIKQPSSMGW